MTISLPRLPHIDQFEIQSTTQLTNPFTAASNGIVAGWEFHQQTAESINFYRLKAVEVSSNELLTAIVLNRLAYGPTPDELQRVRSIGPNAFIEEQLAPEKIVEDPALDAFTPLHEGWEYFEVTVKAGNPEIWLGLDDGGVVYLDDLSLVKGAVAGAGPNLIRNGDFEQSMQGEWNLGRDYPNSRVVTNIVHSGQGALLLQGEYVSGELRQFMTQQIVGIEPNELYTLSFWRHRRMNRPNFIIVRVFDEYVSPDRAFDMRTRLQFGMASPEDLRAYHVLRALKARRQLLEVLVQFTENHFVTAVTKSADYFGNYAYFDGPWTIAALAAMAHFKDLERFRAALLRPDCTFQDLLRISVESVAMICYLDTFFSYGYPGAIPNENFARELLELYTFGVDNGYDQNDVVTMARVWTGWRVDIVDPENEFNPLAPKTLNAITEFSADLGSAHHFYGVFTCNFLPRTHDPNGKVLFPGKRVDQRFGEPYAGRSYELAMPARSGTNGVQDGYDVVAHLANQPFTQEFICVKLCRLFVHDDFAIGYDFTAKDLSAEGRLVRECMRAWENSAPKGNIRSVLRVIFNSDLFRNKTAAFQKVKTPLEFVISSIRALRTETSPGRFTADTDGYSLALPMDRMGRMILFDREQPDGFPETAGPMVNVNGLLERTRFAAALLMPAGTAPVEDRGANYANPVELLKKFVPSTKWNNAAEVAGYFLGALYPGAGKASMDLHRSLAIGFLNTGEDGKTVSNFADLPVESPAYDIRVRSLVAMLLSLYNFSEQ